ncbi:MAG: helix-turn-helix domain-containing protein [Planktomarina sp.]|nr:helix-turn-helix domain-containing protein [Planktomarina sp.]
MAVAKAAKDGRYKGHKQSIDRSVITNMLDAGSSVTAVARSLNISRQSVYRIKAEVEAA